MMADKTTAQDDLTFIRQLMSRDDDGATQRNFGRMYAMWGLLFALPLLPEWARLAGLVELPLLYWPIAVVVILAVITVVSVLNHRRSKPAVGVRNKASNAVFGGVGWANLAVLLGLVLVSYRLGDGRIMMLHAVVVFAFQGAAWFVVWALRRTLFPGLVAAGWYVFAVILGALIPSHYFVLAASIGLLLLMVVPGFLMMRTAPDAA